MWVKPRQLTLSAYVFWHTVPEKQQKNTLGRYTGAHKKVIEEITIMASVRRGW